jgi:hypothetical protein
MHVLEWVLSLGTPLGARSFGCSIRQQQWRKTAVFTAAASAGNVLMLERLVAEGCPMEVGGL